jgi:2-methylcitrate dehydratase PrpD
MAITAPPNCAVRNRDENRAQNTWRTPESGVSLSQFYWRTRTIHQNAGVSRRKLAKQCVFDWYGVTLAGSNEPVARILGEEIATSGQGSSSIVGFNLRCSPVDAALINGATSHALDYDDVHLLIGHPTAAVLPAVLSIAEAKGRSGMDVLRAFIAGYDAAGEHGSVQSRQRSPAWRTICVTAPVVRA